MLYFQVKNIAFSNNNLTSGKLASVTGDLNSSIWPNGRVPYHIDSNLPNQDRVTDAVNHWNSRTFIYLYPRTNEADFVTFRQGDRCNSSVGKVGGEQVRKSEKILIQVH